MLEPRIVIIPPLHIWYAKQVEARGGRSICHKRNHFLSA